LAYGEGNTETNRSVIVFCENKTKMNKICEELAKANIINLPFNDNVKQISLKMRYRTLNLLADGKVPVLVSDNLGSRGLDTMNVSHVIQFEYAKTAQEYL
jgi:superfamily II DNA/RNA helicase